MMKQLPIFLCLIILSWADPQRTALETLYTTTNQNNKWVNQGNWMNTENHCFWYGVTCRDGTVISLNLTRNGLVGGLDNSLASLVNLELLDISFNNLIGYIPTSILGLKNLTHIAFDGTSLRLNKFAKLLGKVHDVEIAAPVKSNFAPIGNNFGMITKARNVNGSVYNNDNDNNNNNNNNINPMLNVNGSNNVIVYNTYITNNNINSNMNNNGGLSSTTNSTS
jgi:hypothetical protein